MATPQPIVQVRELTAGHGQQVVQSGLNFEIAPGEVFVIVGASGSGKSTLLRHLIGLQRPLGGQVLVQGQDLYDGDETCLLYTSPSPRD